MCRDWLSQDSITLQRLIFYKSIFCFTFFGLNILLKKRETIIHFSGLCKKTAMIYVDICD